MDAPLPVACKTALAQLADGDARAVYEGGFELSGEVDELCLARLWPDFASLAADGRFLDVAQDLYGPLADWLAASVAAAPIAAQQGSAP
jgi:exodeoxyribonuclease V gamma subunit